METHMLLNLKMAFLRILFHDWQMQLILTILVARKDYKKRN